MTSNPRKLTAVPMVNVGGASQESIAEARGAINDILAAAVENSTKVEALHVLEKLCAVNASVTGCTFTNENEE